MSDTEFDPLAEEGTEEDRFALDLATDPELAELIEDVEDEFEDDEDEDDDGCYGNCDDPSCPDCSEDEDESEDVVSRLNSGRRVFEFGEEF
jgi:hypothetical protein